MKETEKWITVQEAAEVLSVNPKTIRRRIADGSIEAKRVGPKLIRVNVESLGNFGRHLNVAPSVDEATAAYIARVVADAPPLNAEQRETIMAAFAGLAAAQEKPKRSKPASASDAEIARLAEGLEDV